MVKKGNVLIFMEHNTEQSKAIEHNKGPMIVLAGPGSGKTRVITNRVDYLINNYNVRPYEILVITFTKAAANEMKQRYADMGGSDSNKVNFGTFHAVFFSVLKNAYGYTGNNIIRNEKKQQIIKELVLNEQIETQDQKELIDNIENEISFVKSEMISLDTYLAQNCTNESFKKIYSGYNEQLRNLKLLDFDDMVVQCYNLFSNYPNILKAWQERYKYILIDEFQDINKMQYDIVKMLAKPQDNLFIVGDDDQSIYRFRGAKPDIMLNFKNDYPTTKEIFLEINYRSSKCVVDSANKVIKNNQNRFKKNIVTINESGEPVKIVEFKSSQDENTKIVGDIIELYKKGTKLEEMAVLYRTNTQPRALIDKMMEYNVPFSIKDGVPSIYDHWISQNILSYINAGIQYNRTRLIDRATFLKILNRPNRYIKRDCLKDSMVSLEQITEYYSDKDWMVDRIEKLFYDLKAIGKMSPFDAVCYIRNAVGYEEYLKEYASYRKINEDELMEVLEDLADSSKNCKTHEEWFLYIEEYTEKLKEQARLKNEKTQAVTMATFHGAKGLEFDVVFIIDANEGIMPHKKAEDTEDIEEERRMFYVAMTRARKLLNIFYVNERYKKKLEVSRFVGEIFVDKEQLMEGTLLEHRRYGRGKILKNDGKKMMVKFDNQTSSRLLDIDFCVGSRLIKICL